MLGGCARHRGVTGGIVGDPKLPRLGLNRPIFARFDAMAQRVTQDPAGPFCTMKLRTARGFCADLRGSGQTAREASLCGTVLGPAPDRRTQRAHGLSHYFSPVASMVSK